LRGVLQNGNSRNGGAGEDGIPGYEWRALRVTGVVGSGRSIGKPFALACMAVSCKILSKVSRSYCKIYRLLWEAVWNPGVEGFDEPTILGKS
jgi:hypothetical protein